MRRLALQLARYGTVGALGVVVDLGLFNLLRATVFEPDRVAAGPLLAKIASGVIAIVVVWLGNRYWTFRATRRSHALREALEFFAVALGGLLIGLACLGVSHYLLGFTSAAADNLSTNVIGLALGSVFRFTLYKLWVFHPERVGVVAQGRPSPR
jgi:putative flippase GtrA